MHNARRCGPVAMRGDTVAPNGMATTPIDAHVAQRRLREAVDRLR